MFHQPKDHTEMLGNSSLQADSVNPIGENEDAK